MSTLCSYSRLYTLHPHTSLRFNDVFTFTLLLLYNLHCGLCWTHVWFLPPLSLLCVSFPPGWEAESCRAATCEKSSTPWSSQLSTLGKLNPRLLFLPLLSSSYSSFPLLSPCFILMFRSELGCVSCSRTHSNWRCDCDLTPSFLGHASGKMGTPVKPAVVLTHHLWMILPMVFLFLLCVCVCVSSLSAGYEWDGACVWRGLRGTQGSAEPLPPGHVATRGQDWVRPGNTTRDGESYEFHIAHSETSQGLWMSLKMFVCLRRAKYDP